jgi:hypothetical protein
MTKAFLLEVLKQYFREEVHPHDTTDLKQTHTSIAIFSTACYNLANLRVFSFTSAFIRDSFGGNYFHSSMLNRWFDKTKRLIGEMSFE